MIESRTERRKTYMALYHARRRTPNPNGLYHSSDDWVARAKYIAKHMYPECLIGMSDDEMIAAMRERRK